MLIKIYKIMAYHRQPSQESNYSLSPKKSPKKCFPQGKNSALYLTGSHKTSFIKQTKKSLSITWYWYEDS